MLTREAVYRIIDNERAYQDANYGPDVVTSSGLTRRERDLEVSPGILMLSEYVDKAKGAWVSNKGDSLPALQQVAKIAAIAVRILERAGESAQLLQSGLR